MMEDMKKILEAVACGEITPEEAEMLIKALKEKEEKESGKSEKKEKKTSKAKEEEKKGLFVIDQAEVASGDLFLTGQRVVIRGRVKGDVTLFDCDTEFSGEVDGDMVLIGGKIRFEGGRVDDDLTLIGVRVSGDLPEVGGETVRISNFFASGILNLVSPILKGIGVNIHPGKKLRKFESLVVSTDREINENVYADQLIVKARLKTKNVIAESIVVEKDGILEGVKIRADDIVVHGKMKCSKLEADELNVSGEIEAGKITADDIQGTGVIKAARIEAENISSSLTLVGGEGNESRKE